MSEINFDYNTTNFIMKEFKSYNNYTPKGLEEATQQEFFTSACHEILTTINKHKMGLERTAIELSLIFSDKSDRIDDPEKFAKDNKIDVHSLTKGMTDNSNPAKSLKDILTTFRANYITNIIDSMDNLSHYDFETQKRDIMNTSDMIENFIERLAAKINSIEIKNVQPVKFNDRDFNPN